jgi:hypothetical protein
MSSVIETHENDPIAVAPPVEPGPRWSRRALVAAGLVVVLAGGAGTGLWLHGRGSDGPTVYYPQVDYTLHPLEPSATSFSLGSITIAESGADVQILSVRPIYSDNLEYLGAFAVWPRDLSGSPFGVGPGFPAAEQSRHHPLDQLIPAAETTYGTTATSPRPLPLSITVGFKFRAGDRGVLDAVEITYRAGTQVKHMLVKQAVIACVAPRSCAQPAGQSDADYWSELTGPMRFVQSK